MISGAAIGAMTCRELLKTGTRTLVRTIRAVQRYYPERPSRALIIVNANSDRQMKNERKHIRGIFVLFSVVLSYSQTFCARADLDPQQILKQLAQEIPEIRTVAGEDLEPNPKGEYRRHAFIRWDFNQDGVVDITICGTDAWVQKGASRRRNGHVLIASKNVKGGWTRVFFTNFLS